MEGQAQEHRKEGGARFSAGGPEGQGEDQGGQGGGQKARAAGEAKEWVLFSWLGGAPPGQTPEFSIFGQGSRGLWGGFLGGVVLDICRFHGIATAAKEWGARAPPRADTRIQHFRAGVQGASGGSLGRSPGAPRSEAMEVEAQPSPKGCIRPLSNATTHCPSSKGVSRCRV